MTNPDLFGHDAGATPIRHAEKVAELRRELRLRATVYPRQVERGRLDEAKAERQTAVLEAILADYEVRPWPQTMALLRDWRPKADTLTLYGVSVLKLHRDELLAGLAFAVHQLRQAGILKPEEGSDNAKGQI